MKLIRIPVFLFLLFSGTHAAATMVTVEAPDRVDAGTNFAVEINVSDLEPDQLIGAFSFTFTIVDTTLAEFVLPSLIDGFGGALGDNSLGETIGDVTVNLPDSFMVFEISLLSSAELMTLQTGGSLNLFSFDLFAFNFDDFINRTLGLVITDIVLSDDFGNVIDTNTVAGTNVILVPEPSVLALLLVGLLGISRFSRNKRRTD